MLLFQLLDLGREIPADGFTQVGGYSQAIVPVEARTLNNGDPFDQVDVGRHSWLAAQRRRQATYHGVGHLMLVEKANRVSERRLKWHVHFSF